MDEKRMTVIEHLVDLRKTLSVALLSIVASSALCFTQLKVLMPVLLEPIRQASIVFYRPTEAFATSIRVATVCGAALASPIVFAALAWFVSPGLTAGERRIIGWLIASGFILFSLGAAFGYFILLPSVISFTMRALSTTAIEHFISLERYTAFVVFLLATSGLVFQLPIVLVVLIRSRLVTVEFLRKIRIYVIISVFALVGLLVPGPDLVSQIILGVPLYLLYEVSLIIGSFVIRPRDKTSRSR